MVSSTQFNVNEGGVDRGDVDGGRDGGDDDGDDDGDRDRVGLDGGANRVRDGNADGGEGMNHFDFHSQASDFLNVSECEIPCNDLPFQVSLGRGLG